MDAIYLVKMYVEPKLFGKIVLALIDHNKPFTSMPMLLLQQSSSRCDHVADMEWSE